MCCLNHRNILASKKSMGRIVLIIQKEEKKKNRIKNQTPGKLPLLCRRPNYGTDAQL